MPLPAPIREELRNACIGLYSLSLLFVFTCVINNVQIVKKLRSQDTMLYISFVLYSGMLCLVMISGYYASNDIPLQLLQNILTDTTEVQLRIFGSILVLCLEQTAALTIWAIKLTLIVALFHLTSLEQLKDTHSALRWIAAYTLGGFIALEVSMFGVLCRPVQQYWAVPVNNMQCATYSTFSAIELALSLSSSAMIMGIAGSIAYNSNLSIGRKVLVAALFGMGITTVLAAILSLYYRLNLAEPNLYRFWDVIEASIAVWIGSVVCSWHFLDRFFHRRSFENAQRGRSIHGTLLRAQQPETRHNPKKTWWSRFIDSLTLGSTKNIGMQEYEMNNRTRRSRVGHTTTVSTGTIMLPHTELSQYLNGPGPRLNNNNSLSEDPDAGPAIAYRVANRIE